jgi:hypothetical protein
MKDRDVRVALLARVGAEHAGTETMIIEELGLCHGDSRVDVAVVNSMIHGYEIKSESDTLARLPSQIGFYNAVLDRATLVVSERHRRHAESVVPPWWGLILAVPGCSGGGADMVPIRADVVNPAVDPRAQVQLLWRNEALAALEEIGSSRGLERSPRAVLYERLVELLPAADISDLVRSAMKTRARWRPAALRASGGDSSPPSSRS